MATPNTQKRNPPFNPQENENGRSYSYMSITKDDYESDDGPGDQHSQSQPLTHQVKRHQRPSLKDTYMAIPHAKSNETDIYLGSITETEQELLSASKVSFDSDGSGDFGDRRPGFTDRTQRRRFLSRHWVYAVVGLVVGAFLFGVWGGRSVGGVSPVGYVSIPFFSLVMTYFKDI